VIGMATAINPAGQGIGFAIPVNMIKTLLPQLRTGHVARSWLGVMIRPVTDAHVEPLGLPSARGAIVARVVPGGPADKGGLKAGDVIVGFDGKPIDASTDLQWLASTAGEGAAAELDVFRRGERQKLRVTLAAMPGERELAAGRGSPDEGPRGNRRGAPEMIPGVGVSVSDNTPPLRKRLSLETKDGVIVTDVDAGSPAATAGLQPGDVILVVGTTRISSAADFQAAVERVKPGQLVSLVVLRAGETLFLDFTRAGGGR
jgi:serine protease Do